MNNENRMTTKELSKLLNMSEQTIRILIQKNYFEDAAQAVKISNNRYYYIIYKNKIKKFIS